MKPNNHNPYTRSDIEKYHSKKLSAKEMHDMEAYALEDPFFADAMDGYVNAQKNVSDVHLATIKKVIEQNDEKIISVQSRKNNWVKYVAAASIILFIAIGALYFFNSDKQDKNVAISTVSRPMTAPYIDPAAAEEVAEPAVDNNAVKHMDVIAAAPQQKEAATDEIAGKANNKVVLRGTVSLHGNEPLIIIDGAIATKKQMDTLNEKNIVSINVLKGSDPTTVYGSKGANGVVIITTTHSKKIKKDSANKLPEMRQDSFLLKRKIKTSDK